MTVAPRRPVVSHTPGAGGSAAQWKSWWRREGKPKDLNVEGRPRATEPTGRWLISGQPLRGYGSRRWYGDA